MLLRDQTAVKDFPQLQWDEATEHDCRMLVRLAVAEDLERQQDWTTLALVPAEAVGKAAVVARESGVVAGLKAAALAVGEYDQQLKLTPVVSDGAAVQRGDPLALLEGPARSMLTAERVLLNLLSRLSGVATLTRQYVDAIAGTKARIYDTRKTTPGWRRLEKLAVLAGGGFNHRLNLASAVLIKDNHLAWGTGTFTPADAVRAAREFLEQVPEQPEGGWLVEVEVDTLDQLREVLPAGPDIVLLDNMSPDTLRAAVELRDREAPNVSLEASGGVNLQTIRGIAETGVDRISVGALTHQATWLDIALDWAS